MCGDVIIIPKLLFALPPLSTPLPVSQLQLILLPHTALLKTTDLTPVPSPTIDPHTVPIPHYFTPNPSSNLIMEPIAGALYAAESIVSSAVAFAKGITHPTLPLHASLTHITSTPLPRTGHTLSVIAGRAYVFGGESSPGQLADNSMNIVILPSSGVLEADFTSIPARPSQPEGRLPSPRKGHTAVVVGESIYIYGGEGTQVDDEKGRIWVFSTISNSWSYLDPQPGSLIPGRRSGHAAASSEFPGPKDVVFKERAPQKPADPAKAVPEPAEEGTWGTLFVVGGKDANGTLLNDALAFDVKSRTWSNIPSPPGEPREGASVALVGNYLYRFGGKGNGVSNTNLLEFLDVSPVWKHAEGGTTPIQSGWTWEEFAHVETEDGTMVAPLARSGAGLVEVTTGQGRHYLLAVAGQDEGSTSEVLDDIWAFQLPSERVTAASFKDATRAAIKRDTNEGKWGEVKCEYVDAKGEEEKQVPPGRGVGRRFGLAVARGTEVDGASVVVWGGVDENGVVKQDGWLITVHR